MRLTKALMIIILILSTLSVGNVLAKNDIYRWVDKDGVVHFGDQEPHTGSAERINIKPVPQDEQQTPAIPANAQANTGQTYAQKRRAQRIKNRQQAAQKQRATATECDRARRRVAHLEPSTRVLVTLEDGTVTRMDDTKRIELLNDAKDYISRNCD